MLFNIRFKLFPLSLTVNLIQNNSAYSNRSERSTGDDNMNKFVVNQRRRVNCLCSINFVPEFAPDIKQNRYIRDSVALLIFTQVSPPVPELFAFAQSPSKNCCLLACSCFFLTPS